MEFKCYFTIHSVVNHLHNILTNRILNRILASNHLKSLSAKLKLQTAEFVYLICNFISLTEQIVKQNDATHKRQSKILKAIFNINNEIATLKGNTTIATSEYLVIPKIFSKEEMDDLEDSLKADPDLISKLVFDFFTHF